VIRNKVRRPVGYGHWLSLYVYEDCLRKRCEAVSVSGSRWCPIKPGYWLAPERILRITILL
jgi:hypothetical protein